MISTMDFQNEASNLLLHAGSPHSYGCTPNQSTIQTKTTREHIEDLSISFIEAINSRDLSPTSPPWNHLSDNFQVDSGTGARPRASNKEKMLEAHRRLAEANPEYHIFITGPLDTTINEKSASAQVVMNAASTGTPGVPAGIERSAVTILEFKKFEGRWLAMRESTMSGIGRMEEGWF